MHDKFIKNIAMSNQTKDNAADRASKQIKAAKECSNYNTDTQKFIDDVNKFYDSQIKLYKEKYNKKVTEYKEKNWAQNDDDQPFKDFLQRIKSCGQDQALFNKQVQQNCKHGDNLFTLANVVNNEAGTSNSKAKEAIAYAYLNRYCGIVIEPQGAEISHYKKLNICFTSLNDSDKYVFIPNFTKSLEAAGKRLSDSNPTANDPTSGATHWLSPSGLGQTQKSGYYFRKKYGTYFPTWARANDDPMVTQYIKQGNYYKNYKELKISGVDDSKFLFYKGAK